MFSILKELCVFLCGNISVHIFFISRSFSESKLKLLVLWYNSLQTHQRISLQKILSVHDLGVESQFGAELGRKLKKDHTSNLKKEREESTIRWLRQPRHFQASCEEAIKSVFELVSIVFLSVTRITFTKSIKVRKLSTIQ